MSCRVARLDALISVDHWMQGASYKTVGWREIGSKTRGCGLEGCRVLRRGLGAPDRPDRLFALRVRGTTPLYTNNSGLGWRDSRPPSVQVPLRRLTAAGRTRA